MATNDPLVPSMIFRSRTTKALSNVTEQNACSRSLFSATSLMRTSVMTTADLLFPVAVLILCSSQPANVSHQTPRHQHPPAGRLERWPDGGGDPPGVGGVAGQGEHGR